MTAEQAQSIIDLVTLLGTSTYWIISFLVVNFCCLLFILFFVALKAGRS